MAICDLAATDLELPQQMVLDTSLLLALREEDDNPQAQVAREFLQRLRIEIRNLRAVAWLPMPVLQECYHILLSRRLRLSWEKMAATARPPNWLVAYKQNPKLLAEGYDDLALFDELLAAIPVTIAQPADIGESRPAAPLDSRMRHFVTTYHLLPQDALILAHTERLGVKAVATLDREWRRVTEFDIYTAG